MQQHAAPSSHLGAMADSDAAVEGAAHPAAETFDVLADLAMGSKVIITQPTLYIFYANP